jgi:hypothetical protein
MKHDFGQRNRSKTKPGSVFILTEVYVLKVQAFNVFGLCEEAELEAQMSVLAQMFIRIPNVQFSTEPAFLQNPC